MLTQKKGYEKPQLIRRGDIESVTQGIGELGSGDMWHRFTSKDGCLINGSPFCTYGS